VFRRFFDFKLEEKVPALLLHLPKLFADVFGFKSGLGCFLVEAFSKAALVRFLMRRRQLLLPSSYFPSIM